MESVPVRYVAMGLSLFVLDFAVFFSLKLLGTPTAGAQFVSRTVGAAAGFPGHKRFSFRNRDSSPALLAMQGTSYLSVTVLNVFLSPLLVVGLEHAVPVHLALIKVLAEFIMVIETYVLLRWVFRTRRIEEV